MNETNLFDSGGIENRPFHACSADYPLLGFDNVLLPQHMAARTHTAVENMSWAVRDVVEVLNGRPAMYPAP